jgi:hypothetical protein
MMSSRAFPVNLTRQNTDDSNYGQVELRRITEGHDEMNHEFDVLCLANFGGGRMFLDGEELLRLGDYAIPIRGRASHVGRGIGQGMRTYAERT